MLPHHHSTEKNLFCEESEPILRAEALDLWEEVEEDYEAIPLPNNQTIAQMKSLNEKRKIGKSEAKAAFCAAKDKRCGDNQKSYQND